MSELYQHREDGKDWTEGKAKFGHVWDHVSDELRFHRGQGFKVAIAGTHDFGPKRTLRELKDVMRRRLNAAPLDTILNIKSEKDGFVLGMRKHFVPDPVSVQMQQFVRNQLGDGYLLGMAGPNLWDCSGLTLTTTRNFTGITMVHKATWQMLDPRVHSISRSQIKPMDMLFLHGSRTSVEHVAYFLDYGGPGGTGRVIDAEPHDTHAPSGWSTPNFGTGVRVRSMISGYYCDWESVVKIGRLYAVNGKP